MAHTLTYELGHGFGPLRARCARRSPTTGSTGRRSDELAALNDRELADLGISRFCDPRDRPRQRLRRLTDMSRARRPATGFLPNSAGARSGRLFVAATCSPGVRYRWPVAVVGAELTVHGVSGGRLHGASGRRLGSDEGAWLRMRRACAAAASAGGDSRTATVGNAGMRSTCAASGDGMRIAVVPGYAALSSRPAASRRRRPTTAEWTVGIGTLRRRASRCAAARVTPGQRRDGRVHARRWTQRERSRAGRPAQNGTASAAVTKRATTFLRPAFSKSMVSLSPSTSVTVP